MPKFAANLSMMFTEWDFLDRFAAAADAGFTAVEYLFPYAFKPEEISDRLKNNNLVQALFNLPPGDWVAGERGLASLPARRDEFRASVSAALQYAKATGAMRLHIMSGIADSKNQVAQTCYRDALNYACELAAPLGVDILIEPINGRDMPGYFMNDFNTAIDLIAALALPNLKLQYDIYHRQILHGDVTTSLDRLLPIIGHIQAASVPNRNEPNTGELDDARIFRHIDAIGYTGFIGCEYRPANGTLDGLSWFNKGIV